MASWAKDVVIMVAVTLFCAILLVMALIYKVHAEQRIIYGADGKVAARAATDTQGTTTIYDARGNVVARETKPRPAPPRIPLGMGSRW
jgi:hypothetical protein